MLDTYFFTLEVERRCVAWARDEGVARAGGARDLEIVPQFTHHPWNNFRFLIFLGLVESYLAVQLIDFLNLVSRVGKARAL